MNSTYWINKIMDTMYTQESNFYVGLSSTLPNADGTNITEPNGNGYARVLVTGFSAPNNGVVKNTDALVFPKSSGVWFESTAKAKYWLLFDGNGTTANLLSSGELDEPKTVESNTVITIEAETLSVTLADYEEDSAG